jgi:cold shock CspA family protein
MPTGKVKWFSLEKGLGSLHLMKAKMFISLHLHSLKVLQQ